jgi:hypothetical protein
MCIFLINPQFLNSFNFVELHFDNYNKADDGQPEDSQAYVDGVNRNRPSREDVYFFFRKAKEWNKKIVNAVNSILIKYFISSPNLKSRQESWLKNKEDK